jgi:hypothetical protein
MVPASASSGISAALKYKKAALVVLTTSFGFALIGFDSGVFGSVTGLSTMLTVIHPANVSM